MTRAPQPGLLCRAWFRHTARANRKAAIQAAALKVAREREALDGPVALSGALGSVPKVNARTRA